MISFSNYLYKQNIGMISCYSQYRDPAGSLNTDITLLSFDNVPISAIRTSRTPIQVRPHIVPAVNLSLPHLSIENNGRVFNLQGRAVPAKAIHGIDARKISAVHR